MWAIDERDGLLIVWDTWSGEDVWRFLATAYGRAKAAIMVEWRNDTLARAAILDGVHSGTR